MKATQATQYRVKPDGKVKLNQIDTENTGPFESSPVGKEQARAEVDKLTDQTAKLQERLYAESKQALLIVLQAMDAGGKDGTIKQVMSGVNPQSCRVSSFKAPSAEERAHDFLWRIHKSAPARGFIGIFNRSHYEDILWPRVHEGLSDKLMKERFRQINDFEQILTENGTTIIKLFLHISKDQQKRRIQRRLDNPDKHWKFDPSDIAERKLWPKYMSAYEEIFEATSTKLAPWYVIPGDNKWFRDWVVATIVRDTLKEMDPHYPPPRPGIDFGKVKVE